MSLDLRATVRKRFMWLAAASLLALQVTGCEWVDTLGLEPGEVAIGVRQPSVSGGGIGHASSGSATGLSGGASGAGNGGHGDGAGH